MSQKQYFIDIFKRLRQENPERLAALADKWSKGAAYLDESGFPAVVGHGAQQAFTAFDPRMGAHGCRQRNELGVFLVGWQTNLPHTAFDYAYDRDTFNGLISGYAARHPGPAACRRFSRNICPVS